jgi:sucrose-6-phosphate hydrolase SacC (GH32 family)
VLLGWINNGWNQGGGKVSPNVEAPNNTLSLPRDLSVTSGGLLRQRCVPELQQLRKKHTAVGPQALPSGGGIPKVRTI